MGQREEFSGPVIDKPNTVEEPIFETRVLPSTLCRFNELRGSLRFRPNFARGTCSQVKTVAGYQTVRILSWADIGGGLENPRDYVKRLTIFSDEARSQYQEISNRRIDWPSTVDNSTRHDASDGPR
ncbi:hypothetical protein ISN45_Aa05g009140 [Arabidopsis thaliana x Arabidopsis arenosa]|uniref:Uncharacterized protein n=1 Tax=Arabidopsis thaliana x Arabidopsis arenosa TaxID=1240361 RepID=A0A8T1ZKV4_9BRAS|nr:hypothetical protein ISN45_Aa05g009140 [Arabidopsis thaliana x Arabidopsis arenosa]